MTQHDQKTTAQRRHLLVLGAFLATCVVAQTSQAASPLALLGDRFEVEATWRTAAGATGSGTGVALTDETGYFWFFSPTNTEVVVKVLDACSSSSGHFWVFAGGLTDVDVELTVTDTATGEKKTYRNPQGTPFRPIQDTGAFATCNAPPRCGQGAYADLAATPRPDPQIESLAMLMSDRVVAPQAVYDRVLADVGSLRAQGEAQLNFAMDHDPQSLILTVDANTHSQMLAGNYHAWDCLNRWYGVQRVQYLSSSAVVYFRGVFDIEKVMADYKELTGIVEASTNDYLFPLLPPGFASLCGWPVGDTYYYFVNWSPPLRYYTSQPGQAPVARGPVAADPAVQLLALDCYEQHSLGGWLIQPPTLD